MGMISNVVNHWGISHVEAIVAGDKSAKINAIVSGRALQPIDQVIGSWRNPSSGAQCWKILEKFLAHSEIDPEYTKLPVFKGLLQVRNIFQPNSMDAALRPVLAKTSFQIDPRTSVVVMGPSGSGKSTLTRVIVGALKPRSGNVRLDGHDIQSWDPEDLGKYIGYLVQDVELLSRYHCLKYF